MKNFKLIGSLVLAATGLAINPSFAADDNSGPFFGKKAAGKWIVGIKAANIDPNVAEAKDTTGIGVVLGYEFAKSVGDGTSSVELEYIVSDEENISQVAGVGPIPSFGATQRISGSYEADILNLFFTYKSPGDLYYKIKGGLSYTDLNVSPEIVLDRDFEDVALAAGVGLGYRFQDRGAIELEYSQDAGNADIGILGLNGMLRF